MKKCIYCSKPLVKGTGSKEHVFPRSTIPKGVDAATLTAHVCKDCNSYYGKLEQAFKHNTYISILNAIANHTETEEFISPVSGLKFEPLISGKGTRLVFDVDPKYESYAKRMIAKIAFHVLIHNNPSQKRQKHYDYIPFEDTHFRGDEICFEGIRNFIRHGDDSDCKIQECFRGIPLKWANETTEEEIEANFSEINNAMHVVGIARASDWYFATVGLFIGFYELSPKYIIPLCGNAPDKPPSDVPRVRYVNFKNVSSHNLLKNFQVDNSQPQSGLIKKIPNNHPMTGVINNWLKKR